MASIIDNTGSEILVDDDKLGDNIALEPSPEYDGKLCSVAMKNGNAICWNCFEPLAGRYTDLVMGEGIVRFCKERECHRKVMDANSKRAREAGAGRIITSG